MVDATSITEESLKTALTERLKAIHVEVTDMSGTFLRQAYIHKEHEKDGLKTKSINQTTHTHTHSHTHKQTHNRTEKPKRLTTSRIRSQNRRLRPILHLARRVPRVRGPDEPAAAPRRQRGAARRDRRHPRLERKVPDARGVGAGARRGPNHVRIHHSYSDIRIYDYAGDGDGGRAAPAARRDGWG